MDRGVLIRRRERRPKTNREPGTYLRCCRFEKDGTPSAAGAEAMSIRLQFSYQDACKANNEWGCNCGPSALAAVLGVRLNEVRPLIPEFDKKRYVSPSMMKAALGRAAVSWSEQTRTRRIENTRCPDALPAHGLCRIQWTGPWTQTGANPRWAYQATHWIAAFNRYNKPLVFDINRGLTTYADWLSTVPALITGGIKRADGGWFLTHIWHIDAAKERTQK